MKLRKKKRTNDVSAFHSSYKTQTMKRRQAPQKDLNFEKVKLGENELNVWRVNQQQLEPVPERDYGKFYDGDSYLIYNSQAQNNSDAITYNVFVWIGNHSTIDEYTTAALKMVEFDTVVLNKRGNQHRETQDNESESFLSLFQNFNILKGGYDPRKKTVGNKAQAEVKRLFHIKGSGKYIKINEISYRYENILSDDVFIIDHGTEIYLFQGKASNHSEKLHGVKYLNELKANRSNCTTHVIDECTDGRSDPVFSQMPKKMKQTLKKKPKLVAKSSRSKNLYKLSDATGQMKFEVVSESPFKKSALDPNDVFIFDDGVICYVWIGSKTTDNEKDFAIIYGQYYLQNYSNPKLPITIIRQKRETKKFWSNFN